MRSFCVGKYISAKREIGAAQGTITVKGKMPIPKLQERSRLLDQMEIPNPIACENPVPSVPEG